MITSPATPPHVAPIISGVCETLDLLVEGVVGEPSDVAKAVELEGEVDAGGCISVLLITLLGMVTADCVPVLLKTLGGMATADCVSVLLTTLEGVGTADCVLRTLRGVVTADGPDAEVVVSSSNLTINIHKPFRSNRNSRIDDIV